MDKIIQMKNENQIIKYVILVLDIIALTVFCIMAFMSVVELANYNVIWPISLPTLWTKLDRLLIFVAFIKIYLYFDKDRKSSIIGLCLLCFILLLKQLSQCDYVQIAALIVSMLGIRFEKIVNVYVSSVGVSLIITYLMAILGIIPNIKEVTPWRRVESMYYMGFTGHNPPMALWLFFLLGLFCLLSKKKSAIRIVIVIASMLMTILLFVATDSNTSFIIAFGVSAFALLNFLLPDRIKNFLGKTLDFIFYPVMIFVPVISFFITLVGICLYGKVGNTEGMTNTIFSRFMIIYWELKLSGLPMPFHHTREADIGSVDFSYFLSYDLDSGMYDNVDYNLFRGLGAIKRGQLFGGSDIEYFNILLFDGLMILVPYILLTMYLMYKAYKTKNHVLMVCIAASVFYGNFEALKSGYTAFQLFFVALLSDLSGCRIIRKKRVLKRRRRVRRRESY